MNRLILSLIAVFFGFNLRAQTYVTIPDANFVSWLQANYPSAMSGNQMDITNSAITTTTMVLVNNKNIGDLTGIQYFTSLVHLECIQNQLSTLPVLPNSLQKLWCYYNQITGLPALPSSIVTLNCENNYITSLPSLPNSLLYLRASQNNLTSLPTLPPNLDTLTCALNFLTGLVTLPNTLQYLDCGWNVLNTLPVLPPNLKYLDCSVDSLSTLPNLPASLESLNCSYNQLTNLPALPTSLVFLGCSDNKLTGLPVLPPNLNALICPSNKITCFPIFPSSLGILNINLNPVECVPNYVPALFNSSNGFPLCSTGNTYSCPNAEGVVGFTYLDGNTNCFKDGGDIILKNVPLKLYDSSNTLVGQTISAFSGVYNLSATPGSYKVSIDTAAIPYSVSCSSPGVDSIVQISGLDSVNFAFTCKPGFDIGTQAIIVTGIVFPGQFHTLRINAGGITSWYGGSCAFGIAGQVQVTVTGKVSYAGPFPGALTPVVSGNVYTYSISDFGLVNPNTDFRLIMQSDTTAQAGDTICVDVVVTPSVGDSDTSNNLFHFCYQSANSLDPNIKEVYPVKVPIGYNDWLTYSIHFQNTGNAPAFNIRLGDTLDNNLDLSTFQVIGYSHPNNTYLNTNRLTVYFPNIMLPDSATDPSGSIGYIQYRIKPKSTWAFPAQIKNTAYIYFDYNPPIVTNTTVNSFQTAVGVSYEEKLRSISVYPNPATSILNVSCPCHDASLTLTNMVGSSLTELHFSGHTELDIKDLEPGLYFIQVKSQNGTIVAKFVKQ